MLSSVLARAVISAVLAFLLVHVGFAQRAGEKPRAKKASVAAIKVTQIDIDGLAKLIKPVGKPLLINFWATWCDPCREEFPDLVQIDTAYRGKIDFVTVSLDDLDDIRTVVPRFLTKMKAKMPAYLLKTPDESAAITMVSKDWAGNLPMTVLFDTNGNAAYQRNGKVRHAVLVAEIDKVLAAATPPIVVTEPIKHEEKKR